MKRKEERKNKLALLQNNPFKGLHLHTKIYPSPLKTILPLTTTRSFLLPFPPFLLSLSLIPNKVYVLLSNSNLYIFFFPSTHPHFHTQWVKKRPTLTLSLSATSILESPPLLAT
ncbi:unnamed protein product [Tuber melanosporum]|uniref:(Perigord truffle) hypothetical protein n=1 Tax=Tuber melanosporum (strain Mel28) TaxID=656061 RepID=D5G4N2_TUBMM|nr:uncharacterized protein GSTUM_00000020001 [Tuber melanosporum]CAZ79475.1 unnamed protein product [Tuber melanosporum]